MSWRHHIGANLGLLRRRRSDGTIVSVQKVTETRPRFVSSSYFEVPKRGTQMWIDAWISKQRICPFSKNSHNEVVGCPPPKITADRLFAFIVDEVHDFDKSKSPPGKYSCRLLIFPDQAVIFDFMSPLVTLNLQHKCEGVLGMAGSYYEPRDDRMTIQATFFSSPESMLADKSRKSAQLAPWNTTQLVKYAELKKERFSIRW
jgi:hypothetical protein